MECLDEPGSPIKKTSMKWSNYDHIPVDQLSILIISKPFDEECQQLFCNMVAYLYSHGLKFMGKRLTQNDKYGSEEWCIKMYSNKYSIESVKHIECPEVAHVQEFPEDSDVTINRVITLGGDGTILFTIKMFYK